MNLERSSGILLHTTSFPSLDGIGDLGPQAFYWVDFLAASPNARFGKYCLSVRPDTEILLISHFLFCRNPYLVKFDNITGRRISDSWGSDGSSHFSTESRIDYGKAIQWKLKILDRVYENYKNHPGNLESEFTEFKEKNQYWLSDYSLFMAIKDTQDGHSWLDWPERLRKRDQTELIDFSRKMPSWSNVTLFDNSYSSDNG